MFIEAKKPTMRTLILSGCSFAVLTAYGSAALAQDAAAADPEQVEEVVVTGSRIASGFQTPTPVTVASAAQLQAAAPGNLADALNQLPAFKGSTRTTGVPTTSGTSGAAGQNLLNLRGLGTQRNLVLLDGRRIVASNTLGATDINVLPQQLVSRVEVVTGGASAAYGSDAVAGVVNFILDTRFQGLKMEVQGGTSTYNDAKSARFAVAGGRSFLDGRLRLVGAAEYAPQDGIGLLEFGGRDWLEQPYGQIPNPVSTGTPRILVLPNVRISNASYGGLITSGPLKGTAFGPGGAPYQFDYGTITGNAFQSGGEGPNPVGALNPWQLRQNAFLHLDYDISDNLSVFAEGLYARMHSKAQSYYSFTYGSQNQFTIFRDNAYLPDSVRSQMLAQNLQSFTMGKSQRDLPPVGLEQRTLLQRFATGINGRLPGNWSYSVSYVHGRTDQDMTQPNFTRNRRLYAAADAVRDPATGQVVCRSTLAGLDPGCVPLNVFGVGSTSPEAAAYILGDATKYLELTQDVVSADMQGDLGRFALPAGPISVAFGVEYRKEKADQTVDPISMETTDVTGVRGAPAAFQGRYGGFQTFNPAPLSGAYSIKDGYIEVGVPLLKDVPFADSLSLNAALRRTSYSTSGAVTTWKAGLNYQVNSELRLRYTRSRDIRAPNILELFNSLTQGSANVIINNVTTQSTSFSSGNPDLNPEKADTTTYGGVFQPSWLPGFSVSADYYDIVLNDAIGAITPQLTVDQCAAGNQLMCAQIETTASGSVRIFTRPINLSYIKTNGWDFEVAYSRDVFDGRLTARLVANKLNTFVTETPGSPPRETAGSVGAAGQPKWSGVLQLNYQRGPISVMAQERYIGRGLIDSTLVEGVDINRNRVDAVFYTDLTTKYTVPINGHESEFFLTVSNLFNKDPPPAPPQSTTFQQPTNAALYDTIGRYYTLGVRVKF
jgi:outer membrane receptor protein involved in Fe transport